VRLGWECREAAEHDSEVEADGGLIDGGPDSAADPTALDARGVALATGDRRRQRYGHGVCPSHGSGMAIDAAVLGVSMRPLSRRPVAAVARPRETTGCARKLPLFIPCRVHRLRGRNSRTDPCHRMHHGAPARAARRDSLVVTRVG